MKNTDGEPMEGMEGWRSHTLQMACMRLYMRQWVKRSWISIGKEKEQKIVWLVVLSLVRNKMREKKPQGAAEECRIQKHSIILDITKLQGQESGD